MASINPDLSAVFIWLPDDVAPSDKDFDVGQSWTLEQAAEQAYNAMNHHNLRPWVRSDGRILDQFGIAQVMSALRAQRMFPTQTP
jgi:hypothetical protein